MTTLDFETSTKIKEEIMGLEREALEVFEKLVKDIYFQGVKLKDKNLDDDYLEISRQIMDQKVMIILEQVSNIHLKIIYEAITILQTDFQSYHRIDAELEEMEEIDFQLLIEQQRSRSYWQKPSQKQKTPAISQKTKKIDFPCLWIIYHHFCSLAKSNYQVSQLINQIEENNESRYIPNCQDSVKSNFQYKKKHELQWRYCKQNELNQRAIRQIVPNSCPVKMKDFKNTLQNILKCHFENMTKQEQEYAKRFFSALEIGDPFQYTNQKIYSKRVYREKHYLQIDYSREYFVEELFNYARYQQFSEISEKKAKKKNKKKKKKNKNKANIEDIEKTQTASTALTEKGSSLVILLYEELIDQLQAQEFVKEQRMPCMIPKSSIQKWWAKVDQQIRR